MLTHHLFAMEHSFTPACPLCDRPMRLGRRIAAVGAQPVLQNFECRTCELTITEAASYGPQASGAPPSAPVE